MEELILLLKVAQQFKVTPSNLKHRCLRCRDLYYQGLLDFNLEHHLVKIQNKWFVKDLNTFTKRYSIFQLYQQSKLDMFKLRKQKTGEEASSMYRHNHTTKHCHDYRSSGKNCSPECYEYEFCSTSGYPCKRITDKTYSLYPIEGGNLSSLELD